MAMTEEELQAIQNEREDYHDHVDESGDESDSATKKGPRTLSERRRRQNTIFKAWMVQKAEALSKKEVKEAAESTKEANEECLSIRDLLAKQQSSARITKPREYQMELFERAKERNVIAVLDTGSGKTFIATLLLRHVIDKELEDRANGKPPRISFFLVCSPTGFDERGLTPQRRLTLSI